MVVTVLFYDLFKPVSRTLSFAVAAVSLVGCSVGMVETLHLARTGVNTLVFFGVYCVLIGYLIFKSTFLPSALGALMAIAGLGWLMFASSAVAKALSPYNAAPGMIGEGALTLWLLIRGVDVQRWNEQAAVARGSAAQSSMGTERHS